jgi:hypothetical protein
VFPEGSEKGNMPRKTKVPTRFTTSLLPAFEAESFSYRNRSEDRNKAPPSQPKHQEEVVGQNELSIMKTNRLR